MIRNFFQPIQLPYISSIFIEGKQVLLLTDHKPLCGAFSSLNPAKSDRQQRQLAILTEYISDIGHTKGDQNVIADCLLRPTLAVIVDMCDLPAIAAIQLKDPELKEFPELKKFKFSTGNNNSIYCDNSTGVPRSDIPGELRKPIFDSIHAISRPGIKTSCKIIKTRFFWPYMDKTIKDMCNECQTCQKSKIQRHTKSAIHPIELPTICFNTVHLDLIGHLPVTRRRHETYNAPYRYALTCIDCTTKWIEAEPLPDITARSAANAFVHAWITRWGVSLHVITDHGTQFESELFSEIASIVSFYGLRTTSYHLQTNGMVKCAHRTKKTAITTRKES